MPTTKKNILQKKYGTATVVDDMKDYTHEPFFVEKAEKAKIALRNVKWAEETGKSGYLIPRE